MGWPNVFDLARLLSCVLPTCLLQSWVSCCCCWPLLLCSYIQLHQVDPAASLSLDPVWHFHSRAPLTFVSCLFFIFLFYFFHLIPTGNSIFFLVLLCLDGLFFFRPSLIILSIRTSRTTPRFDFFMWFSVWPVLVGRLFFSFSFSFSLMSVSLWMD
jgi:hypothetical protein